MSTKHEIDFDIYTRGAENTLIVVDASEYYERPSNVIIDASFPDINKTYTAYVNPNTVTALTTKSFGYSDTRIAFPDGLYGLRMSVKPNNLNFKCINYFKLDKITSDMAKLLEAECIEDVDLSIIYDVDKYLVAAKANANSNPKVAIELYKEALKRITKLTCK
jgi:hypothetical protein